MAKHTLTDIQQKVIECQNAQMEELLKENGQFKKEIAELERKVAELRENQTCTGKRLLPKNYDKLNLADKLRYKEKQVHIARIRLEEQLVEKDKEIEQIKGLQNQKAIECLKEVKVKEMSFDGKKVPEKYIACFNAYIDNKIKELEDK